MICGNCKNEIPNTAMFCTVCGAPVNSAQDELTVTADNMGAQNAQPQNTPPFTAPNTPPQNTPPFTAPNTPPFTAPNNGQYGAPNNGQYGAPNNGPYGAPNYAGATIPAPKMLECYKKFWKNYAEFSGRARRSEYWYVVLMNVIISLVSFIPFVGWGLWALYSLAVFVPTLALIVRRLHDLGKEWYWIFMILIPLAGPFIMIYFFATDSQPGPNEFGPNPKYL